MRDERTVPDARRGARWPLALVCGAVLAVLADPALADHCMAYLKQPDTFFRIPREAWEDCLRTPWLQALLTGAVGSVGGALIGSALGAGLSGALTTSPEINELRDSLKACRDGVAQMQDKEDALKATLDTAENQLWWAGFGTDLHQGLNNFTNAMELASLALLGAELLAAGGLIGAGPAGIGAAKAFSAATRNLPKLTEAVTHAVARKEASYLTYTNMVRVCRELRQQGKLSEAMIATLRKAQSAWEESVKGLTRAEDALTAAKTAIAEYSRWLSAGEAGIAGGSVANTLSGNSLLQGVRNIFGPNADNQAMRNRIAQLRDLLWKRREKLGQMTYERLQRAKQCDEIEANLNRALNAAATPSTPPAQ